MIFLHDIPDDGDENKTKHAKNILSTVIPVSSQAVITMMTKHCFKVQLLTSPVIVQPKVSYEEDEICLKLLRRHFQLSSLQHKTADVHVQLETADHWDPVKVGNFVLDGRLGDPNYYDTLHIVNVLPAWYR